MVDSARSHIQRQGMSSRTPARTPVIRLYRGLPGGLGLAQRNELSVPSSRFAAAFRVRSAVKRESDASYNFAEALSTCPGQLLT
ncbi:unnamed protein product [Pleuronectes platessa]|uniref:Uncharacterized protein n=1 Tax=Pleuronectes platessa TaxID=8262 RepID=A0A9N7VJ86_PLEPL|nr:unnamed protein product [Pleuronectes platessa]